MRLHIIVEDEGSGRIFWEKINEHFLSSKANLIVAGGITNIVKRLREEFKLKYINSGDYVLIAFDNTGTTQSSVQMEKLNKCATEYRLNILFTTYYCIEEIFISFDYLLSWVNPKISVTEARFFKFIGDSIKRKQDYYLEHDGFETEFDDYITKRYPDISSYTPVREQLSANILEYITHTRIGFKITKSELGACWVEDCCQTSINILSQPNTKIKKFIKQCGIPTDLTAKDKLDLIDKHSVFSTGGLGLSYFNTIAPHIK